MPRRNTVSFTESQCWGILRQFLDLNRLGAVVVKTLTRKPRLGSHPHRSTEVPSGMLASIGLQNVGVDTFIRDL